MQRRIIISRMGDLIQSLPYPPRESSICEVEYLVIVTSPLPAETALFISPFGPARLVDGDTVAGESSSVGLVGGNQSDE